MALPADNARPPIAMAFDNLFILREPIRPGDKVTHNQSPTAALDHAAKLRTDIRGCCRRFVYRAYFGQHSESVCSDGSRQSHSDLIVQSMQPIVDTPLARGRPVDADRVARVQRVTRR